MLSVLPKKASPKWLDEIKKEDFETIPFNLREIIGDSLFYPAGGSDGDPVKYFAGYVYSFIYADCGYGLINVLNDMKKPRRKYKGYDIFATRLLEREELIPGWRPPAFPAPYNINWHRDSVDGFTKGVCCLWIIFERSPGFDDEHGPHRFSLLYVSADYTAALFALYIENNLGPTVLYAKDHPFGVTRESCDIDSFFSISVLENHAGKPDYCVHACDGESHSSDYFLEYGGRKVCDFRTIDEGTYIQSSKYHATELWCLT